MRYSARLKSKQFRVLRDNGLVNTVRIAWAERIVGRRMIFRAVVGEERTCCRLMEGMIVAV
jgi:hypothetical protein